MKNKIKRLINRVCYIFMTPLIQIHFNNKNLDIWQIKNYIAVLYGLNHKFKLLQGVDYVNIKIFPFVMLY